MLEPIQKISLTDAVFEQLKGLIIEGRLQPGDKIPSEKELCAQLGVSRTALREAKKALVVMGLLDARPGQGTFVKDDLLDLLTEPLSLGIQIERGRIDELIETRLIIETASAALAAERATDEDRQTLKQILERQQSAVDEQDMGAFAEADLALHTAIAQAAQNAVLMRTNLAIRSLLKAFIDAVLEIPGSAHSAVAAHNLVAEAILDGNADRAREAMKMHLAQVREQIIEQLGHAATARKERREGQPAIELARQESSST